MGSWKEIKVAGVEAIEITHRCGHTQVFKVSGAHRLGAERDDTFFDRQFGWLSNNLCPGCYSIVRGV